jgi:hypothetical protein
VLASLAGAAVAVVALLAVIVTALRRWLDMTAEAARNRRVTAERDLAREQGAIIAEQRSREDVAKTLDDGNF